MARKRIWCDTMPGFELVASATIGTETTFFPCIFWVGEGETNAQARRVKNDRVGGNQEASPLSWGVESLRMYVMVFGVFVESTRE